MRRLIIPAVIIGLGCVLALMAAYGGASRAQQPLPTPKGQLGGAVPLTTQPAVSQSPFPTPTPSPGSVVGSWLVTNPQNGTEPPTLLTFAADGTVTGAAGDAHGSSFHGAWSASGDSGAAFTMFQLTFDANGSYAGALEVRGALQVDATGNAWSGLLYKQEIGRGSASQAVTGPFPAHGTRITVQPVGVIPAAAATPAP